MSYTISVTNLTVAQINGQQIGTAASQMYEWHKHNKQAQWGYSTDTGVTNFLDRDKYKSSQRLIYYNSAQAFELSATGLKPNTVHTFTFNDIDVSAFCQPLGGALGATLTTNSSGQINFTYFYTNDITTTAPNDQFISASPGVLGGAASTVTSAQSIINSLTGNKIGILKNSDESSVSKVTIIFYSQQKPTPVERGDDQTYDGWYGFNGRNPNDPNNTD